jgi:hypothetical protein
MYEVKKIVNFLAKTYQIKNAEDYYHDRLRIFLCEIRDNSIGESMPDYFSQIQFTDPVKEIPILRLEKKLLSDTCIVRHAGFTVSVSLSCIFIFLIVEDNHYYYSMRIDLENRHMPTFLALKKGYFGYDVLFHDLQMDLNGPSWYPITPLKTSLQTIEKMEEVLGSFPELINKTSFVLSPANAAYLQTFSPVLTSQ